MIDFKTSLIFIFVLIPFNCIWAKPDFLVQTKNQMLEIQVPEFNDFGSQFIKELQSGLSVKIVQILRFNDKKRKINIYQNIFTIRYDLWDEVFLFKDATSPVQKIKDMQQILSILKAKSNYKVNFNTKKIKLDRDFFFETLYVINPISKEKSGIIKKWMAERFVGPSSQEVGSETNSFIAGMVNTVVQTELDKNIYGADKHILYKSKKINFKTLEAL